MQKFFPNVQFINFLRIELLMLFLLAGCIQADPSPTAPSDIIEAPTAVETAVPTQPPSTHQPAPPETFTAQVISYNLGDATVLQQQFPEDSRFRNMPVRLEGVIGVPQSDTTHPVVLILHGSHAVCPNDSWPCTVDEEQPNYEGFTYLVKALAEAGYIALSINVNAEHTFGFGESPPTIRTQQLIDLHLAELAAANAGESDKFGVALNGRADLSHMVWVGHSRAGDFVNWIVREQNLAETASPAGYGPVDGILLVAPANIFVDALPIVDVPFSVILPACDADVSDLNGQGFYESARLDPERENWGTTVYLEGAEHNRFNTVLPSNYPLEQRPDCTEDALITAVQQQQFLSQYTQDFLQTIYGDPAQAGMARERLGMAAADHVPTSYHNLAVRFNFLPSPDDQFMIMQPQSAAELSQNLLGGPMTLNGLTAQFCPGGYYVPANEPGSKSCKRVNFNQPGFPQQVIVSWETSGAEWRMAVPDTEANLTEYASIQLRSAIDPLSELNPAGEPQTFFIELVDESGNRAQVAVPQIPFPLGEKQPNLYFDGGYFTGHVHMQSYRIPLAEFHGIDLDNVTEIALLFDQTESGALFLADLTLIRDSKE